MVSRAPAPPYSKAWLRRFLVIQIVLRTSFSNLNAVVNKQVSVQPKPVASFPAWHMQCLYVEVIAVSCTDKCINGWTGINTR